MNRRDWLKKLGLAGVAASVASVVSEVKAEEIKEPVKETPKVEEPKFEQLMMDNENSSYSCSGSIYLRSANGHVITLNDHKLKTYSIYFNDKLVGTTKTISRPSVYVQTHYIFGSNEGVFPGRTTWENYKVSFSCDQDAMLKSSHECFGDFNKVIENCTLKVIGDEESWEVEGFLTSWEYGTSDIGSSKGGDMSLTIRPSQVKYIIAASKDWTYAPGGYVANKS